MSDSKFEDLDEDVVAGGEGARGSRSVAGQTRETTDSAVQNVKASEKDDPSAIYEIVHKDGKAFKLADFHEAQGWTFDPDIVDWTRTNHACNFLLTSLSMASNPHACLQLI